MIVGMSGKDEAEREFNVEDVNVAVSMEFDPGDQTVTVEAQDIDWTVRLQFTKRDALRLVNAFLDHEM